MVDRNAARALVVKYHADRDERLIKLFGKVLESLHGGHTAAKLMLEIQIVNELIDSYENSGRFAEAEQVRISRAVLVREHQEIQRAADYADFIGEAA